MSFLIRADQPQREVAVSIRRRVLSALFPPPTLGVDRTLMALAFAAFVVVALLTLVVRANPHLAIDASIERWIQVIGWGPLATTFPFFSWIGGPGGIYMQVGVLVLVLLLNPRAWILAAAATAGGLSYFLLVNFVNRPRPTIGEVLRVTEHPGASSFPSGHVIFISISAGILMLCVGYRYLPPWARPIGWAVASAIVLTAAVSRINVGAHWPTDVLASGLIAVGWLALVTSFSWISSRALSREAA
jgi:membrane-associated phospholipid phosphatase